jgi:hypothetical protein
MGPAAACSLRGRLAAALRWFGLKRATRSPGRALAVSATPAATRIRCLIVSLIRQRYSTASVLNQHEKE